MKNTKVRLIADTAFVNGKIYTMSWKEPLVEAVAVKQGTVIALGNTTEIKSMLDCNTQIIDLEGKTVLPGFIDSHAHPMLASFFKSGLELDYSMTLKEVLNLVDNYIKKNPDKDVYFGQGYSEWLFDRNGPPKELLDDICKEKPIILIGSGLHSGWCNSKALEQAQVSSKTADPEPGIQYFCRDKNGSPQGGLVESEAIATVIKASNPFNLDVIEKTFSKLSQAFLEAGVTAINDGGVFSYLAEESRAVTDNLMKRGLVKQRIRGCEFVTCRSEAKDCLKRLAKACKLYNTQNFRVDYLKILNDGSSEAGSCAMIEPFEDGSSSSPLFHGETLQNLCIEAASAGFDIHIHGIGDWTIRETLNAAQILREQGFLSTRIASIHSINIKQVDLDRFAANDVIINTTPTWIYYNPSKICRFGVHRANRTFLMNSLHKGGARLTFGSDYPADEHGIEPLKGIEMGITRKLYGTNNEPLLPLEERLNVQQMIEGYTINAAYQMNMENIIGSIEIGKLADLVVLEHDLFEININNIHATRVLKTIINGKIMYSYDG